MATTTFIPQPVKRLIFAVTATAILVLATQAPAVAHWTITDALSWLALAALIALLEQFPIHVRFKTETFNMSMTDAVWTAGLLLVSPSVLLFAVAAGGTAGQLLRRRQLHKAVFNVGQYVLAVGAGVLVYTAFGSPAAATTTGWLVAVAAMAVCFLVNALSVATVVGLVERKRLLTILRAPFTVNVSHWICNTSTGILGAVLWVASPRALVLLVAPLVLSFFAYRSWVEGVRERDRMRNLYEAGRTLFAPIEADADFRPFLGLVERMLEANRVELVVAEDDRLTVHASDGGVSKANLPLAGGVSESIQTYLASSIAPSQVKVIGTGDDARGFLVVYRAEPLSDSEQALVDALGGQIAVMLQNHQLFFETLEHAQLLDIIADSSDGIFVLSPEHRVLSWNPAMETISGLATGDVVGRGIDELLDVHAFNDGTQAEGGMLGETGDAVIAGPAADRTWIRYTRNPIRDRDGALKAYVVVARDVTAEMQAEQMKRDFVATVSHELRTPLTPLKGFLTTLMRGTGEDTPEARQEYYRIMLNQTNRLERLITDLLEVSRIEAGKSLAAIHPMELSSVLAEQVKEFSESQPDRSIGVRMPKSPVIVAGDPFRVGQVVSNLVSNALKYSPREAPVTVSLSVTDTEAVISVRDRGEGVPAAEQHRVFERFHRVEGGLTRTTGGTGLGLYIARHLVESMDGRIWLRSEPGIGSTFSFSLPLAAASSADDVAMALEESAALHARRTA
jgi:PAS domain S-box-containing protein